MAHTTEEFEEHMETLAHSIQAFEGQNEAVGPVHPRIDRGGRETADEAFL